MALRLGIDTGGTYTDAIIIDDERGTQATTKVLTRHHDLAACVGEAIRGVVDAPLSLDIVAVSTTLATNALVEGQGGEACLVLIGQGPEVLRRAGLADTLADNPVVFVAGGHHASGEERTALDEQAIREAVSRYAPAVQAFAVASLFAVRNPAHEQRARDIIAEQSNLPVTCGHELSGQLDAPRRALTAFLNARLVPLISELIDAVAQTLAELAIDAPLMVVKGDGSMVAASLARQRPVETILSGPAASTIGARHLSGDANAIVVDIGGTTTDIGILHDGWPALTEQGAHVAGLPTMVAAINAHTYGLGGDSELRIVDGDLRLGPQRSVPLSLLASEHEQVATALEVQWARGYPHEFDAMFALRRRQPTREEALTHSERELWRLLEKGPVALEQLHQRVASRLPLQRLRRRGLVAISSFTPSDAAHVLGLHHAWSTESAITAANLTARSASLTLGLSHSAESLARAVIEQLTQQSCTVLVDAIVRDESGSSAAQHDPLLERALSPHKPSLLGVRLKLERTLVAIGASAAQYYPAIAQRLGARLATPPDLDVANAIGAAVSDILQRVSTLITLPRDDCYRVHTDTGTSDFDNLEAAARHARDVAEQLATSAAEAAGAAPGVTCDTQQRDSLIKGPDGHVTFLESRITAIARGQPAA